MKVRPELRGWTGASASATVRTPALPPPPRGAWRVLLRFQLAASDVDAARSGGIAPAFLRELRESLGLPPGRLAVAETRRAQARLFMILVGTVVSRLVRLVGMDYSSDRQAYAMD